MQNALYTLVYILGGLVLLSSLWNLISMVRVNLLFEQREADAIEALLVRTVRTKAGKDGLLGSHYGVYSCKMEAGTGEFTSANPYGKEDRIPQTVRVVPTPAGGGVIERCRIGSVFVRKILPTWIAVGLFSAFLLFISNVQA